MSELGRNGAMRGKVVWITGAARGQGRSHAQTFAEAGADLLLTDICADLPLCVYPMGTTEQLAETARRCRELGARVVTAAADVRDQKALDLALATGLAELGRVDVLINNAGVGSPGGRAEDLSEEAWALQIDILLSGPWRASKAVIPHLKERGSGVILNTSSAAGLKATGSAVNYASAKHGLIGLTRAMARDLAPDGIRVNAVCPGSVRDDPDLDGRMLRGVAEDYGVDLDVHEAEFAAHHLLPSLVEARDISEAYLFLAADTGARITGIALPVDAGFTTK